MYLLSFLLQKSTLISIFIHEARRTFSIKGRTSRKQYICSHIACTTLLFLGATSLHLLGYLSVVRNNADLYNKLGFYIFSLLLFLFFFFILTLTIRRIHDIGYSGWLVLLNFVPIVQFFLYIYLLFKSGSASDNKYGPPLITSALTLFDKIFICFFIIWGTCFAFIGYWISL